MVADGQSKVLEPEFNFRKELRFPYFNPTTMAIITLFTVDARDDEGKPSVVGYAFFPLFLDRETKQQPEDQENTVGSSHQEFLLAKRRLPDPDFLPGLLPEEAVPVQGPVGDSKDRLNLDKLPCASLLIRVRNAPKIGFRLLKLKDVKLKDRDKLGVWPFPKAYSLGTYCNSECRVNEAELKLFETLSNDLGRIKKSKETMESESINFSIKINK